MRGERLPVPERNQLPGPRPNSSTTYDRYIKLINDCTERDPKLRPRFAALAEILMEMTAKEVSSAAPAAPAAGQAAATNAVCVICMEQACDVGLVHASD